MKKLPLILILFFLSANSIAKTPPIKNNAELDSTSKEKNEANIKKGYIGISGGVALPIGDFNNRGISSPEIGLKLNFYNFGYKFGKNFGISALWFAAAHNVDEEISRVQFTPWTYSALMIGPLISFPLSNKFELDFRPMVGYTAVTKSTLKSFTISERENYITYGLGYNFGTNLRFNISNSLSLMFNADYFFTRAEYEFTLTDVYGRKYEVNSDQNIATLSAGIGIALRIR